jgi:SAM-dependent methyltransferase
MNGNEQEGNGVGESWSTYWQGAERAQAWSAGGSAHPRVIGFWEECFAFARDLNPTPRLLDIASGSGAVVGVAEEIFGRDVADITCVELSAAAVQILRERFPGATGIQADAGALPLAPASFDLVCSQFGIEYAGSAAFDEALRVVAGRGVVAVIAHYRDGFIHRQCRANRDATAAFTSAGFLAKSRAVFEAGFAALAAEGDSERLGERYRAAGQALAPAVREVEGLMSRYGREVADGTLVRVYRDVRDIHGRLSHFEAAEVLEWLERMEREIAAYHGRMASMCEAAIDAAEFRRWCENAAASGFDIIRDEPLAADGGDPPLAWTLVARRR